jgi:exodeoxyribonuclease VII large subunit
VSVSASSSKVYLNVPFPAKDRAKELGARWDPVVRKWYVSEKIQLGPFQEWLPPDSESDLLVAEKLARLPDVPERGLALSAFLGQVSEAIAVQVRRSQWVRAEISQLRPVNGGHLAVELVEHDADGRLLARLQGFVWAGRAASIREKFEHSTGAELAVGLKVLLQLSAELNPNYGLRAVIEDIDPAYTLGDIEANLKAIRETLTREGIIELNRRLPAPAEFCHVAVISPQDAAGLGDFKRDADRLHEAGICRFDYYTAKFQGQAAAASLLEALNRVATAYEHGERFDALCIIRGGGSVTDLYWLNELDLARQVCRLPIPVFSGIGHERDNTVLDEIAHRRCDTPSKVIGWIGGAICANANAAIEDLLSILKSAGDARSMIAVSNRCGRRSSRWVGRS